MASSSQQRLPSKYVKLAKTNLGEDPKTNPAHIEAIRRWLSTMPHLTCPQDDEFLLMFLRQSKFVHAKAQARLDNFCTLSSIKCLGDYVWSTPLDPKKKRIDYYLSLGMHLPLGYVESGKLAFMLRPAQWNPNEMSAEEAFYYVYKMFFMVGSDPRTLIGGLILILDFTGASGKQTVTDPNFIRTAARFFQEALPGRIQRIVFVNESKVMDTMLNIFAFYMKDKMKQRVVRCGSDINLAFEAEPGLKALMPKERGGEGKSFKEIEETVAKNFKEFYANGDKTSLIKVDESKRPMSAKDFLKEYKTYDANVMGKTGTFVKISQDVI